MLHPIFSWSRLSARLTIACVASEMMARSGGVIFFGGTSPTLLSRFPFRRKKTKKNNKKDFARAEWHRLLSEPCSQSSAAVSA